MNRFTQYTLIFFFFFSGFSGLIYESIWSHYLKLFLGHAAYAQTLVLIIFMGGMALGSWLAAKVTHTRRLNLLLAYAIVEGAIGVLALVFHRSFVGMTDLSFDSIIPTLSNPMIITTYKWMVSSLLIAPQSILLGATFPLMSAGFIRRSPQQPGNSLATLYFINSLGACFGVLTSGFLLIKTFGLPGTILTAGIINITLACFVWLLVKQTTSVADYKNISPAKAANSNTDTSVYKILLVTACLTGTSSFVYEVIWIRMLSLILGSSTHAFELMLSAFILGLAMGGLFIQNKIDHLKNPIKTLATIQLVMGLLAASTIVFYNHYFEFMAFLYSALQKNDSGYLLFNISSHFLASLVMLPTTFCAGMTLPIITKILLSKNWGERTIGYVYSANTLGSILGVIITVHFLLPLTGLKNTLILGSLIDIMLAVLLIKKSETPTQHLSLQYTSIGLVSVVLITLFTKFNVHYMSSGVYRHGFLPTKEESLFHRDGKTASVDVTKSVNTISIRTNGKPDASISLTDTAAPDEPTMRLAAWVPFSLHNAAKDVAIIGIGSGITTHSALAFPDVQKVDTIEIEPAMVEGARLFGKTVDNTFHDARSHIFIEDAKSFFTSHNKKYDLIISEPSNPWVSGVAGLFSEEFYHHSRRYLNKDGLFVQWMQIYEMNDALVGSVLKAIANNFDDYQLYLLTDNDLLVVAKPKGSMADMHLSDRLFRLPNLQNDLTRLSIKSPIDMEIRYIGNKDFLKPYLLMLPLSANSDYFPVLDQNAARARYKNDTSSGFSRISYYLNTVGNRSSITADKLNNLLTSDYSPNATQYKGAWYLNKRIVSHALSYRYGKNELLVQNFESIFNNCKVDSSWVDSALWVSENTVLFIPAENAATVWTNIQNLSCFKTLPHATQTWVNVLKSFSEKKYSTTIQLANELSTLENKPITTLTDNPFFVQLILISYINQNQYNSVSDLWHQLTPSQQHNENTKFLAITAILRNNVLAHSE